ncbi:uncharacterized protein BXZ73DRAFT_102896 [Epithele typhae]|uniref:uncharacterized protein n=1 Tax=Epithele typhae TaxID=378194 RepID=UPI002008B520|nr:uncharacterized protein BXZ73DRAFT_102896 [Epithele typhae]KAH9926641.1 hypothetical protein BXZ73DRAFT_102896 [Epithele typhae]
MIGLDNVASLDHASRPRSETSELPDSEKASPTSHTRKDSVGVEQDQGVTKVEATILVFGRGWKFRLLWASLCLMRYVYSLANGTTSTYVQYATSSFSEHTILGTISVATLLVSGLSTPFLAKLADLASRPVALLVALVLFTLGYIIVAASNTVDAVAGGEIIYTLGSTGLDFIAGIIVSDMTSLQWRGFAYATTSAAPLLINTWVSTFITTGISANTANGWRWGFGMFAILVPVTLTPALLLLFWGERKAKTLGALSVTASGQKQPGVIQANSGQSLARKFIASWNTIDALGLLLIGFSFAMLLLPFTLSTIAKDGFRNPSLIAMFVVAGILLISTVIWEWKFAPHPIMPRRIWNRTMMCCVFMDSVYFLSSYLSLTYLASWVYVIKNDWSLSKYTYWSYTQTVSGAAFCIVVGVLQRYTHRYKYLQVFGLCLRVVGQGLHLYAIQNPSTAVLVLASFVISVGGSFQIVGSSVAVQASVPHQDMALASALLGLCSSIGGSVGSAVAAAVWNAAVPRGLARLLGDVYTDAERAAIFGSVLVARDVPEHALVVQAYNDAMRPLFIAALVTAVPPIVAGLLTEDFYLGTRHNAIEDKEIAVGADGTGEEAIRARVAAQTVPSEKQQGAMA